MEGVNLEMGPRREIASGRVYKFKVKILQQDVIIERTRYCNDRLGDQARTEE